MNLRAVFQWRHAKLSLVVFLLLPFVSLCVGILQNSLGPNPAEYLIRSTGELTLRMLCLCLCITPMRVQFSWPELAKFRRSLGLLTFFYVFMHALCYSLFDMGLVWNDIAKDIAKRPFILVGFTAAILMSLLAATSFNRAIRWLGAARWRRLHQAVYAIALLAILHFFWMRAGKKNFYEVWVYGAILALLLGWRVWRAVRAKFAALSLPNARP